MFLINLFIGVLFLDFSKQQKKEKHKFLTEAQLAWIKIQQIIISTQPDIKYNKPPQWLIGRFIYHAFRNTYVRLFFYVMILIDIAILSLYFETATFEYKTNLELIHMVMNMIFIFETLLKILGFGFLGFFHDDWNKFEFFIIITISIDIFVFMHFESIFISVQYIVRVIKGMRALKLIRLLKVFGRVKSVQKLLQTLKLSLPMVLNISGVLMLIYYLFVIFGCIYFKHVKEGEIINDYINFKNFHYALMTLYKVSTADGWEGIMYDIMKHHS